MRYPHRLLTALALSCLPAVATAQNVQFPSGGPDPALGEESGGAGQGSATAEFEVLDNVEGSWVDLVFPAIDPVKAVGRHVWAVNTHGDRVVRFRDLSGQPDLVLPTPWAPVSLEVWQHPDGTERVVVTTRGTHALVVLNPETRRTEALVELPSEPADILLFPETHRAWVACSALDQLVEVDLLAEAVVSIHTLPAEQPHFLSRAPDGGILAAPMLSGNNSTVDRFKHLGIVAGRRGILDLEDPAIASQRLPDRDLFHLDPVTGTMTVLATDVGTLLFGHGVHPDTGELWMLNVESLNKDPLRQSEAAVRGTFVQNRISILAPGALSPGALSPGAASTPAEPSRILDLDHPGLGSSLGQPWAIAFTRDGTAIVGAPLTDNVLLLDSAGNALHAIDETNGLPPGAIVRGVAVNESENLLFVHCWGTNTLEVFTLGDDVRHLRSLDLGFDPSPFQAGREVFFDGHNSLFGNSSCASCHVEGRTDMIAWNLSDLVLDNKGPMVTQPLASMSRTPPFHWRAERPGLFDFNGAFDGLLGGKRLDENPRGDLDRLAAYLDSLQSPANPLQHPARLLDASIAQQQPNGHFGDPITGQTEFLGAPAIGLETSCNQCHTLPTGTSGDTVGVGHLDEYPKRVSFETGHFMEMWRKEQPKAKFVLASGKSYNSAAVGAGYSHAGLMNSLFRFIDLLFGMPPKRDANVTEFLRQLDQGLAPAVHKAFLLDRTNADTMMPTLRDYLLAQAEARHCDMAVYGTFGQGELLREERWFWNRQTGFFHPSDGRSTTLRLREFEKLVAGGRSSFVFVGLPVGSGERFGVDRDADGLYDTDELVAGTDPHASDTDADGFPDGHEVHNGGDALDALVGPSDHTPPSVRNLRLLWNTAKVARLAWETDEPCTYEIELSTPTPGHADGVHAVHAASPTGADSDRLWEKTFSVIVSDLLPSTEGVRTFEYGGTLTVTDPAGNQTRVSLPSIETRPFSRQVETNMVLDLLGMTALVDEGEGTLSGRAVARAVSKVGGPPFVPLADRVFVWRLLVDGQPTTDFTSSTPREFTINGQAPLVGGPFLMARTKEDGRARADFTVHGLKPGSKVSVIVEYLLESPPNFPLTTDFSGTSLLGRWDFSSTPAEALIATTTYP